MIGLYLYEGIKVRGEDIINKITWGIVLVGAAAPWSGIFLGLPDIGIGMGIVALAGLIVINRDPALRLYGLNLSLSMCVALCACMTVYFAYLQPKENYLPFTRAALKTAGKQDIIVLSPDEIFEGLLPMQTGKTYATVSQPRDIKCEGLYIWADRHDEIFKAAQEMSRVNVLLEQKIGSKQARLAHIVPTGSMPLKQ